MIQRIASVSVGGLVPQFSGVLAYLQTKLTSELAARARISGLIQVKPPRIGAAVKALGVLSAALTASAPGVKINVTAHLAAIAAIKAKLTAYAKILSALGVAGLEVYRYDGTAAAFGGEVDRETANGLPGGRPGDAIHALVIATRVPAAWEALGKVLLTGD